MVSPFTISRPTGRASFESVIRSWDESPQDSFSVELLGEQALYGIWRPNWAANEHDFDVEVVSYGWASKYNVGHPDPVTRRKLSAEQAADVQALVVALVEDRDVRTKISPFSSKTARFLGRIEFQENWVLLDG